MIARAFMVILLVAAYARLGLLTWSGYRSGRVKSASPWGPYFDRQKQPRLYWLTMSVHLVGIVAITTLAIAIALREAANFNLTHQPR